MGLTNCNDCNNCNTDCEITLATLQEFEDRLNALESQTTLGTLTFENLSTVPANLANNTLFMHNNVLKLKDATGTILTVQTAV
jgi:uncharacterized coiled-coil protein SlyX